MVLSTAARRSEGGPFQFPSLSSICQFRNTVAKDFQINTAKSNNITQTVFVTSIKTRCVLFKTMYLKQYCIRHIKINELHSENHGRFRFGGSKQFLQFAFVYFLHINEKIVIPLQSRERLCLVTKSADCVVDKAFRELELYVLFPKKVN